MKELIDNELNCQFPATADKVDELFTPGLNPHNRDFENMCKAQGGIVSFLPASDIKGFEYSGNTITKIHLKRVGTYHGKRYERKFIGVNSEEKTQP